MFIPNYSRALSPSFFAQDTIEVAKALLGKSLVCNIAGQAVGGRIVETEAYLGLEDPSCHSFHGRKTSRSQTFYMAAGTIYVYLVYGLYSCFNVITGNESTPEAVLVRALEPLYGLDVMHKNRQLQSPTKSAIQLCSGPGKLCEALSIDLSMNQKSFSPQLYIAHENLQNNERLEIVESRRIGLNSRLDSAHWPLRFYIKESPFVSSPKQRSEGGNSAKNSYCGSS